MTRLRPACDRHTNLQMIPCSLKKMTEQAHAYVCPVPGCGRHHDDTGYFDAVGTIIGLYSMMVSQEIR